MDVKSIFLDGLQWICGYDTREGPLRDPVQSAIADRMPEKVSPGPWNADLPWMPKDQGSQAYKEGEGTGLKASSLADEIAFKIEQQILAGEMLPGQKLQQQDLCDRFGVSRTPVREALHKLQALRLIDLLPNRGARVRVPTRREIEEVFDVRAELEAYAAELACSEANAGLDRELNESIEHVRKAANEGGESVAHDPTLNAEVASSIRGFHQTIQRAAGNRRLMEIVGHLERLFLGDFCCHVLLKPEMREILHVNEHVGIRDAIVARNGPAARELMRAHVRHAKDVLLQYLDERDFWNATPKARGQSRKSDA